MKTVCYSAVPFVKDDVTLALESGITTLIVPDESFDLARGLARCTIIPQSQTAVVALHTKADEEKALLHLTDGMVTILEQGWEIIPVENLLAHEERLIKDKKRLDTAVTNNSPMHKTAQETLSACSTPPLTCAEGDDTEKTSPSQSKAPCNEGPCSKKDHSPTQKNTTCAEQNHDKNMGLLALEVQNDQEARLASKILERGVDMLVVTQKSLAHIPSILAAVNEEAMSFSLKEAIITGITPVGIGHRVCVDTLSLLTTGQGMLVGNSAGFTFLVNAETEKNEYVASRPFRINAGAVHSYGMMPGDTTAYLEELQAGREVLIVDHQGKTSTAIVGRCKTERRPMLHITAQIGERQGSVFLQNAETIRLVLADGTPKSVVSLAVGDAILCHLDTAGRHFGMRISEDIAEE